MIITRFGHTYDAPDTFIKMLARARKPGSRVSIYHGPLVKLDYWNRRSFFGFFRNWRDEDRRRVINGMRIWSKRVLIADEIEAQLVQAGFKKVRVKV